jgi:hypothetical protein
MEPDVYTRTFVLVTSESEQRVRVEPHIYTRTFVPVSSHYKNPARRVGPVTKRTL